MTASNDDQHQDDVSRLHKMGYAQELSRTMGHFSNFAISFSIICILSGGVNSLAQGLSGAGGAALGIGWIVGGFAALIFALGMAQIASAFPTAGGLYHWSSILGGRFWGWLTAWMNLGPDYRSCGDQCRDLQLLCRCLWADARDRSRLRTATDLHDHGYRPARPDQSSWHQVHDAADRPFWLSDLGRNGGFDGGTVLFLADP